MPLDTHEFHASIESPEIVRHGDSSLAGLFPIADGYIKDEGFIPTDESVAHQASDVIGHGAHQSILEINDPWERIAHHEIPRHKIAVHEHFGIGEVAFQNCVYRHLPPLLVFGIPFDSAVALHIPLREEVQLSQKHLAVIERKLSRTRCLLPLHQSRRSGVKELGCIFLIQNIEESFLS